MRRQRGGMHGRGNMAARGACFRLALAATLGAITLFARRTSAYGAGAPLCEPWQTAAIVVGMGAPSWLGADDEATARGGGFSIKVLGADTYTPGGEPLAVVVTRAAAEQEEQVLINGFLLAARAEEEGHDAGEFVSLSEGCASPPCFQRAPYAAGGGNNAPCVAASPDATVTHTAKVHEFEQLTFAWRPPAASSGSVTFTAAVVTGGMREWFQPQGVMLEVLTEDCAEYCETVQDVCTDDLAQFEDGTACARVCAGFKRGAQTGNTLECRMDHAQRVTAGQSAQVHCPHAGPTGGGICVGAPAPPPNPPPPPVAAPPADALAARRFMPDDLVAPLIVAAPVECCASSPTCCGGHAPRFLVPLAADGAAAGIVPHEEPLEPPFGQTHLTLVGDNGNELQVYGAETLVAGDSAGYELHIWMADTFEEYEADGALSHADFNTLFPIGTELSFLTSPPLPAGAVPSPLPAGLALWPSCDVRPAPSTTNTEYELHLGSPVWRPGGSVVVVSVSGPPPSCVSPSTCVTHHLTGVLIYAEDASGARVGSWSLGAGACCAGAMETAVTCPGRTDSSLAAAFAFGVSPSRLRLLWNQPQAASTVVGDITFHAEVHTDDFAASYRLPPATLKRGCDLRPMYSGMARWSERDFVADVVVTAGERVLVDLSPPSPLRSLTVQAGAELVFSDALALEMTVDLLVVEGTMRIGTDECKHEHPLVLTLADNFKRPIQDFLTDPYGGKALIVAAGGELAINAAVRGPTWARLAASAAAGDVEIELDVDVSWRRGDELVLATTSGWDKHDAVRVLRMLGPRRVLLESPLVNDHWSVKGLVDELCEVGMLTRQVKIQGDGKDFGREVGEVQDCCGHLFDQDGHLHRTGYGGQARFLRGSTVRATGIELFRMGQQGHRGRYPWHWHLAGNQFDQQSQLVDSSIHHSNQRCVVLHRVNGVLVRGNVAFDIRSHCYFTEDGTEMENVFDGNLGMYVRPPPGALTTVHSAAQIELSDATPTIFWTVNSRNKWINNVAAGSYSFGYWWALPVVPLYGQVTEPEWREYHALMFPGLVSPDAPVSSALEIEILCPKCGEVPPGYNENNTAHSVGSRGFNFDDAPSNNVETCALGKVKRENGGLAIGRIESSKACSGKEGQTSPRSGPSYAPSKNADPMAMAGRVQLRNPTVWDASEGIWLSENGHRVINPRVADTNRGIKTVRNERTVIDGGAFVAYSARPSRDRPSQVAIESYDQVGMIAVNGTVFMNYHSDAKHNRAAVKIQLNPTGTMPWSDWSVRKVHLLNSDPAWFDVSNITETHSHGLAQSAFGDMLGASKEPSLFHMFPDSDGSLTGTRCGAYVTTAHPFLGEGPGCTVKRLTLPAGGGYAVCDTSAGFVFGWVEDETYNGTYISEEQKYTEKVTLSRLDTGASVRLHGSDYLSYRPTFPLGTTLVWAWDGGTPTAVSVRLHLGGAPGSWFRLAMPYPSDVDLDAYFDLNFGEEKCSAQENAGGVWCSRRHLRRVESISDLGATTFWYDSQHKLAVFHIEMPALGEAAHVRRDDNPAAFHVGELSYFFLASGAGCTAPSYQGAPNGKCAVVHTLPDEPYAPTAEQQAALTADRLAPAACTAPERLLPSLQPVAEDGATEAIFDDSFSASLLQASECPAVSSATVTTLIGGDTTVGVTLTSSNRLCVSAELPPAARLSALVRGNDGPLSVPTLEIARSEGAKAVFVDGFDATAAGASPFALWDIITSSGGDVRAAEPGAARSGGSAAEFAGPSSYSADTAASVRARGVLTPGATYRVSLWATHTVPYAADLLRAMSGTHIGKFVPLPPSGAGTNNTGYTHVSAIIIAENADLDLILHQCRSEEYTNCLSDAANRSSILTIDDVVVEELAPPRGSAAFVSTPADVEALDDSGFELGNLAWRVWSPHPRYPWDASYHYSYAPRSVRSAASAFNGQYGWRLDAANGRLGMFQGPIAVSPRATYRVSLDLRVMGVDEWSSCASGGNKGPLRIYIRGTYMASQGKDFYCCSPFGEWGRCEGEFTVAASVDALDVVLMVRSGVKTAQIDLDNVSLERVPVNYAAMVLAEPGASTDHYVRSEWGAGRNDGRARTGNCPVGSTGIACRCEAAGDKPFTTDGAYFDTDGTCVCSMGHNAVEARAVMRCRTLPGAPSAIYAASEPATPASATNISALCAPNSYAISCGCFSPWGRCHTQKRMVVDATGCSIEGATRVNLQAVCVPGARPAAAMLTMDVDPFDRVQPLPTKSVWPNDGEFADLRAYRTGVSGGCRYVPSHANDGKLPRDQEELTSCVASCTNDYAYMFAAPGTSRHAYTYDTCDYATCDAICRTAWHFALPEFAGSDTDPCQNATIEYLLPIAGTGGVMSQFDGSVGWVHGEGRTSLCSGTASVSASLPLPSGAATVNVSIAYDGIGALSSGTLLVPLDRLTVAEEARWRVSPHTPRRFWNIEADPGDGSTVLSAHGSRAEYKARAPSWPYRIDMPTSRFNEVQLERVTAANESLPYDAAGATHIEIVVRASESLHWPGNHGGVHMERALLNLWVAATDELNATYEDTFLAVAPRHTDAWPLSSDSYSTVRLPLSELFGEGRTSARKSAHLLRARPGLIGSIRLRSSLQCGNKRDGFCDLRKDSELDQLNSTIKGAGTFNLAYFIKTMRFVSLEAPQEGACATLLPCEGDGSSCANVLDGAGFECTCEFGRTGARCELRAGACTLEPCDGGFECVETDETDEGFYCAATRGACEGTPCLNGGDCTDMAPTPTMPSGGFICGCADGFFGDTCAVTDPCLLSPCGSAGKCIEDSEALAGFACICPSGLQGPSCETEVDLCTGASCQNGGECAKFAGLNGKRCLCAAGWTGPECEHPVGKADCPAAPVMPPANVVGFGDESVARYAATATHLCVELTIPVGRWVGLGFALGGAEAAAGGPPQGSMGPADFLMAWLESDGVPLVSDRYLAMDAMGEPLRDEDGGGTSDWEMLHYEIGYDLAGVITYTEPRPSDSIPPPTSDAFAPPNQVDAPSAPVESPEWCTAEGRALHSSVEDCFVAIWDGAVGSSTGAVYDLSGFGASHPGGANAIERNCGGEVSDWLAAAPAHATSDAMRQPFRLGTLPCAEDGAGEAGGLIEEVVDADDGVVVDDGGAVGSGEAEGEQDGDSYLPPVVEGAQRLRVMLARPRRTADTRDADLTTETTSQSGSATVLWAEGVLQNDAPQYHGVRGRTQMSLAPMPRLASFIDCVASGAVAVQADVATTHTVSIDAQALGSTSERAVLHGYSITLPPSVGCAPIQAEAMTNTCEKICSPVAAILESLQNGAEQDLLTVSLPVAMAAAGFYAPPKASGQAVWNVGEGGLKQLSFDVDPPPPGSPQPAAVLLLLAPGEGVDVSWDATRAALVFVEPRQASPPLPPAPLPPYVTPPPSSPPAPPSPPSPPSPPPPPLETLRPAELAALPPDELAQLDPAELAMLSNAHLSALTEWQVAAMSAAQLAALSPEQRALLAEPATGGGGSGGMGGGALAGLVIGMLMLAGTVGVLTAHYYRSAVLPAAVHDALERARTRTLSVFARTAAAGRSVSRSMSRRLSRGFSSSSMGRGGAKSLAAGHAVDDILAGGASRPAGAFETTETPNPLFDANGADVNSPAEEQELLLTFNPMMESGRASGSRNDLAVDT